MSGGDRCKTPGGGAKSRKASQNDKGCVIGKNKPARSSSSKNKRAPASASKSASEEAELQNIGPGCTDEIIGTSENPIRQQVRLLQDFYRRKELFVPMLSIWVASFGGALHEPVTAYFLLQLGATTSQLGNFGAITTVGGLLVTPLYGWLMDTRTAYLPCVLSAGCCAFGCLIRGLAPGAAIEASAALMSAPGDPSSGMFFLYLAHVIMGLGAVNFWNIVGTYIALAFPRSKRDVAVSGFQVQVAALRLLGTSAYSPWDKLLQGGGGEFNDRLTRDRIHMSVCSVFCVFGFAYMVLAFNPVVADDGAGGRKKEPQLLAEERKVGTAEEEEVEMTSSCVSSREVRGPATVGADGEGVRKASSRPEGLTPATRIGSCVEQEQEAETETKVQKGTYTAVNKNVVPSSSSGNGSRISTTFLSTAQLPVLLALLGMFSQAFGETTAKVLWPLHVRKLGWDSHELAYLQLGGQLAVIAGTLLYPVLFRSWGGRRTAVWLPIAAGVVVMLAFFEFSTSTAAGVERNSEQLQLVLHSVAVLFYLGACALLKVMFQHLVTVTAPFKVQGRVFALLGMLGSAGTIVGNLFGTRWFGKGADVVLELGGGVAEALKIELPFLATAALFVLVGVANAVLLAEVEGTGGSAGMIASGSRPSSSSSSSSSSGFSSSSTPPSRPERVFILPGLLGSTDNWVPAAKKLAKVLPDKEFVLLDARNHGKSFHDDAGGGFDAMVADLLELVLHMDVLDRGRDLHAYQHLDEVDSLQRVSIIGHSLGGKTAMRFALRYPRLLRKLVVVDIAPRKYHVDYFLLLLSHLAASPLTSRKAAEEWMQKGFTQQAAAKYFADYFHHQHENESSPEPDPAMVQKVRTDLETDANLRAFLLKNLYSVGGSGAGGGVRWRPNLKALLSSWPDLAGGFEEASSTSVEGDHHHAAEEKPPLLVVRGGKGGYVEIERDRPAFEQLFPATTIETVDGAGHWPHASHPDVVVEKIARFFGS
eukprot:g3592.t1